MSNKTISVYADALKRQETEAKAISTREDTSQVTRVRETSSDMSRKNPRDNVGSQPNRDEIQEFSFRLRDELKVKVQAEVPHVWQKELEEIARDLDVKKLELYRFIIG